MTDIFDKKAKFAIMNLPDEIKRIFNFKTSSKTKLQVEFGDGSVSSFGVSLSGRSGTYHYVHISEYAKLSKQFPQRAEEVITGTLPAVPFDVVFLWSRQPKVPQVRSMTCTTMLLKIKTKESRHCLT